MIRCYTGIDHNIHRQKFVTNMSIKTRLVIYLLCCLFLLLVFGLLICFLTVDFIRLFQGFITGDELVARQSLCRWCVADQYGWMNSIDLLRTMMLQQNAIRKLVHISWDKLWTPFIILNSIFLFVHSHQRQLFRTLHTSRPFSTDFPNLVSHACFV